MNHGHVYFIGAGPGAPDLITVRGRDLILAADVVIFADSLVDPAMCDYARQDAQIIGSSTLTLEEIMATMIAAAQEGKAVVRLHSGDPALYGATHEQIVRLNEAGVPWSIVPGVSSAFAAAAILGAELTVPEITQTVIFSRLSGRASPVPPREELRSLASHGCSLVLFLSVSHMRRVVGDLLEGGYTQDTPAAVVYRATWPDELILRGTLADIADQVREAKLTKQALVLVGPALSAATAQQERRSRLYAPDHSHLFRVAKPAAHSQA